MGTDFKLVRTGRAGRSRSTTGTVGWPGRKKRSRGSSAHFISCRFRVGIPADTWSYKFSKNHPEALVEVTHRMDWEKGRSLENIRVHSPEAGAWEDELRTFKDVYDVEMFGPPGRFCNLHVVTQTPMFALLLRRLNLMWRLPINFRDGVSTWVVIGTEENIRRLEEELRSQSLDVVIEHVHHKSGEKGRALLTHRQADIFRKAMAAGYFEVPRHITLTELADQQGMAVSSLSEILAVVEKKILQEAQAAFLT